MTTAPRRVLVVPLVCVEVLLLNLPLLASATDRGPAIAWGLGRGDLCAELWRLLTCHLVHLSLGHLLWDLAAFVLLGWAVERRLGPTRILGLLALAAFTVDLGFLAGAPSLSAYAGLSGLDSALLVSLCLLRLEGAGGWREPLALVSVATLGALAGKIAWEAAVGTPLFAADLMENGIQVVPSAHLAGAAAACAAELVSRRFSRFSFHRSIGNEQAFDPSPRESAATAATRPTSSTGARRATRSAPTVRRPARPARDSCVLHAGTCPASAGAGRSELRIRRIPGA